MEKDDILIRIENWCLSAEKDSLLQESKRHPAKLFDDIVREITRLRDENEKLRERIHELEKWVPGNYKYDSRDGQE